VMVLPGVLVLSCALQLQLQICMHDVFINND